MDDQTKPATIHHAPATPAAVPTRVVVTLKAGLAFAVANIICVLIAVMAYTHVHRTFKTISVTGSADRNITSNLIIWSATVNARSATLVNAYTKLAASTAATLHFLTSHGIPAAMIRTGAISIGKNFVRDAHGHSTDVVSSYALGQNITVTSHDVRHVAAVGRQVTDLIKQGVQVAANSPEYIYTKLADMKITMLAAATKDATTRATQIAANSGAKLGKIDYANMGVLQINPLYSTSVSGEGNDDTTSYRKTIMAVVHAQFELK